MIPLDITAGYPAVTGKYNMQLKNINPQTGSETDPAVNILPAGVNSFLHVTPGPGAPIHISLILYHFLFQIAIPFALLACDGIDIYFHFFNKKQLPDEIPTAACFNY